jgi:ABC-2 type transport system permease protein
MSDALATEPAFALGRLPLAAWALARRELVRFVRQRSRVIGALGQPILFWLLFGAGLEDAFRAGGQQASFASYFLPGVALMILLFTAIFANISIIEDRREGFLQGVLVSPAPALAIVLGKLLGGTILAVGQALLFLLIALVLSALGGAPELSVSWGSLGGWTVPWLVLLGVMLSALGFVIAWPMDSTHGFHAVMSVVLLPMWMLSGAFFPVPDHGWLAWLMRINPMTYGQAALRRLMAPAESPELSGLPSLSVSVAVSLLATGLLCGGCVWLVRRRPAV